MSRIEFLLIIPGVIYGYGLVLLLQLFRRGMPIEIWLWSGALLLSITMRWYGVYDNIESYSSSSITYLIGILNSLLFAKACDIITPPEDNYDFAEYWKGNRKYFFFLLIAYYGLNEIMNIFIARDPFAWSRYVAIACLILILLFDRVWVRYLVLALFYLTISYLFIHTS